MAAPLSPCDLPSLVPCREAMPPTDTPSRPRPPRQQQQPTATGTLGTWGRGASAWGPQGGDPTDQKPHPLLRGLGMAPHVGAGSGQRREGLNGLGDPQTAAVITPCFTAGRRGTPVLREQTAPPPALEAPPAAHPRCFQAEAAVPTASCVTGPGGEGCDPEGSGLRPGIGEKGGAVRSVVRSWGPPPWPSWHRSLWALGPLASDPLGEGHMAAL